MRTTICTVTSKNDYKYRNTLNVLVLPLKVWYNKNFVDEISWWSFPELFFIRKYMNNQV